MTLQYIERVSQQVFLLNLFSRLNSFSLPSFYQRLAEVTFSASFYNDE